MNYKILLFSTLIGVCLCSKATIAQTATKVHQSFTLSDIKNITIDIPYPYTIETWEGNTILLETSIDIDNAPPTLVKMFLKAGRYEVIQQLENKTMRYNLQSMSRKGVLTSKGACIEKIEMHFLVPEKVSVKTLGAFVSK